MFNDVRPLKGNEPQFLDYLNNLDKTYVGKNQDWIKPLLKKWKLYTYWCLSFVDNKIIAFSAMQSHNMPELTVRLLTRTWIDQSFRSVEISKSQYTPTANMLKHQLQSFEIKHFKKAIITLEPHRSHNAIKYACKRFNQRIGSNFIPQNNKIKTYPSAAVEDYQWYGLMELQ